MFWLLAALALSADVEIEVAGAAAPGDRITSSSTGIALSLPADVSAVLQGEALVLTGPRGIGGVVIADPSLTLDGAVAATESGLLLGGAVFMASGAPRRTTSSVTVPLRSADGAYTGHGYASVGGSSKLSLVLVGPVAEAPHTQRLFSALVGSIGAARPPTSAVDGGVGGASNSAWGDALRGRQLALHDNRGTLSSRTTLDLCSDGRAIGATGTSFHSQAYDVADVSGAGSGRAEGRWSVQGARLTVRWSDGSTDSRILSLGPSQELLLDGQRWLRVASEQCR